MTDSRIIIRDGVVPGEVTLQVDFAPDRELLWFIPLDTENTFVGASALKPEQARELRDFINKFLGESE